MFLRDLTLDLFGRTLFKDEIRMIAGGTNLLAGMGDELIGCLVAHVHKAVHPRPDKTAVRLQAHDLIPGLDLVNAYFFINELAIFCLALVSISFLAFLPSAASPQFRVASDTLAIDMEIP